MRMLSGQGLFPVVRGFENPLVGQGQAKRLDMGGTFAPKLDVRNGVFEFPP